MQDERQGKLVPRVRKKWPYREAEVVARWVARQPNIYQRTQFEPLRQIFTLTFAAEYI